MMMNMNMMERMTSTMIRIPVSEDDDYGNDDDDDFNRD